MNHTIQRHQGATVVRLPIRTQSEANLRGHWAKHHQRRQAMRRTAAFALAVIGRETPLPVSVLLTRIAPRPLDDDNLRGAFKHVRDGIADAFGIDDRDPRVRWDYDQRRGKVGEYGVEIAIAARQEAAGAPEDLPSGVAVAGE